MTEKAFTMRSNEYCCHCGSFDLVRKKSNWKARGNFRAVPVMHCYGCETQFPEEEFARNAIRTLPLTVDDFFFQTNLRIERLSQNKIRPMTHVFSILLITGAIAGLYLIETPNAMQVTSEPKIEWSNNDSEESYEKRVVKSLQLEFEQLVKTN